GSDGVEQALYHERPKGMYHVTRGRRRRAVGGHRLLLRGSVWSFRRRVPDDLVPRLGRSEIVRSLGVEVLAEARRRAALLDVRVGRVFEAVRREPGMGNEAAERLGRATCCENPGEPPCGWLRVRH